MGDQFKFLYREKNGVDSLRPAPDEALLEALAVYFNGPASNFPSNIFDVKAALEYLLVSFGNIQDTYSHLFVRASGGSDFWLGDGDSGNSSEATPFIPTTNVRPILMVFSNKSNASVGNPFDTRIRAHYKSFGTSGDIQPTDPTEFDISNSGPNLISNGDNGRVWIYDMAALNITMLRNRQYGIRCTKNSGAGNYQSISTTFLLERLPT